MKPEDICTVTNRSAGVVLYKIPERHIRREFYPRETKKVPYQEILDVCAQPGGRELIYNYLLVKEPEVIKDALNVDPSNEVEYFMTEDQIKAWMPTCSLDEFKDALDFAPAGVKALIKSFAVSLPLNDVAKREALKKQLNFDVDKAIYVNEESKTEQEQEVGEVRPATRRVVNNTTAADNTQQRRVIIQKKS